MTATTTSNGLWERAVEVALDEYVRRNPKAREADLRAKKYFPGGNTRSSLHTLPFPLVFESGHGTYLTSIDGDTYVDFLGEYSAGIYGHNHPTIRKAVDEALSRGWNYGGINTYEGKLAEMVCERFKPTIELVRFTNSGTEANMCAIATATVYTGRKSIMVFDGAYHGSTIGFSRVYGHNAINLPHKWVHGAYDSIERTKTALKDIDSHDLAAILVEPMQGNAGARPCSLDFLRYLRTFASEIGALLIFDEVQASRLSYHGYNQELGIRPDLMTLGKWIGGGMTFGAFGGRKEVMGLYDPHIGSLTHAGTFNNNVLSMAAGCAGLQLIDEKTVDRLNRLGWRLKTGVEEILQSKGIDSIKVCSEKTRPDELTQADQGNGIQLANGALESAKANDVSRERRMWISAVGSILNIGFSGPGKEQLQALFYHHMLSKNIYLASRGFMALNLETTEEHLNLFFKALEGFIEKYQNTLEAI